MAYCTQSNTWCNIHGDGVMYMVYCSCCAVAGVQQLVYCYSNDVFDKIRITAYTISVLSRA